jgi:hypothetical protein
VVLEPAVALPRSRSDSDERGRSGATRRRSWGRLDVDEVGEGDGLIAVRTEAAGTGQAAAEDAAVGAALAAEVAGLAPRTLIDGGGLGGPAQEEDLDLVGRLVAEPEAALAAGVRAPDPASVGDEGKPAGGAGAFRVKR